MTQRDQGVLALTPTGDRTGRRLGCRPGRRVHEFVVFGEGWAEAETDGGWRGNRIEIPREEVRREVPGGHPIEGSKSLTLPTLGAFTIRTRVPFRSTWNASA